MVSNDSEVAMAIQPVSSLKEFFRDALHDALSHQHVAVEGETEHYVVNVLTMFSDTDALYERHSNDEAHRRDSRTCLKPLVMMLGEALEAPTNEARFRGLQRLGDVSLFIAGFFSAGFARKLIDIDYHIAMGGRAYGTLADNLRGTMRGQAFAAVFLELAQKFQRLVDVLNDVAEMAHTHTDRDILRLYEIWMKTGSPRAFAILQRLGVAPVLQSARKEH